MSIADLLSPLSDGKTYMGINVNSINVGPGSSSFQGPVTVHSPLTVLNNTGTAAVNLLVQNDPPSTTSGILANGIFTITTAENTSSISLNPGNNSLSALICRYTGSGTSAVNIQNLLLPTIGGTATTLNYYENYSGSFNFSGPWTATYPRTIKITRIGNNVTLRIDSIKQNASIAESVIVMIDSLPARFIPASSVDSNVSNFQVTVYDNGFLINGNLIIANNGQIFISFMKYTGSPPYFYTGSTGTGITGFDNIFISYIV